MDAETWKLVVDISQAAAAIAGGLSAVFAGWAISKASKERKNIHLLNHAKTSLERAFSTLCAATAPGQPPPSNRVAWLTTARLIEEYKTGKSQIKDPLTRQECESHEAHWRHQLYLRLEPLSNTVPEYYGTPRSITSIPPVAAIIIHNFAMWPEGKEDPLKSYEINHGSISEEKAHLKWRALRQYLSFFNQRET